MSDIEVTYEEVISWDKSEYIWVDIRDEVSTTYGVIPGAVCIAPGVFDTKKDELPKDKKLVLYCARGIISVEYAEMLRDEGYDAYSLIRGYYQYLSIKMEEDTANEREKVEQIELSIRKKFHKDIFSKFAKAINEYELVKEHDHIAVCISGGKDSMLMAKLFQELKRHNKFEFELSYLVMDPGYSAENRKLIEQNARLMDIPITIFESDIFDAVDNIEKSPCYICARMRRGHLYKKAKELGCNKIALGHHYDDVIETILMGMLYGAQIQTMMPKLHSTNFEGMELIRPLYLIREDDIKAWRDHNGLRFIQCACKFTDTCTTCSEDGRSKSKRVEVKELIKRLKKTNSDVENSIFSSVENVDIDNIIAYKFMGDRHRFTEDNY